MAEERGGRKGKKSNAWVQESPRPSGGHVDEGSSLLDDAERAAYGTDDLLPTSNGNSPGLTHAVASTFI